jgi:hypothetical protein
VDDLLLPHAHHPLSLRQLSSHYNWMVNYIWFYVIVMAVLINPAHVKIWHHLHKLWVSNETFKNTPSIQLDVEQVVHLLEVHEGWLPGWQGQSTIATMKIWAYTSQILRWTQTLHCNNAEPNKLNNFTKILDFLLSMLHEESSRDKP